MQDKLATSMTQRDEREKLADAMSTMKQNAHGRFLMAFEMKDRDLIVAALRTPADGEAHAEIQRLQDAKRRTLKVADERAKENVALREAIPAGMKTVYVKRWRTLVLLPEKRADEILAALSNAPPASEGVREALNKANYKMGWWLSGALEDPQVCAEMKADINAWFEAHQPGVKITSTAPEPADTLDEGPDPLGGEI